MCHVALAVIAALVAVTTARAAPPTADLLASAEDAFAEGTAMRDDAAKARPAFARAAVAYGELWRRGHHTPDLALNRANAHRLAADLPGAIVALHEGLAATPWHRPLQLALEDARSAVGYPLAGDLAAQCRPAPAAGVSTRMSPTEAWVLTGLLWLLACASVARFAMTRRLGWLAVAAGWGAGLAVLAAFWWRDAARTAETNRFPLVVLADDAVLRTGNADTYPARQFTSGETRRSTDDARLPRGVEARELSRRGGWAQVRLAGGAMGWLPETSLLRTEPRAHR